MPLHVAAPDIDRIVRALRRVWGRAWRREAEREAIEAVAAEPLPERKA